MAFDELLLMIADPHCRSLRSVTLMISEQPLMIPKLPLVIAEILAMIADVPLMTAEPSEDRRTL